jgi:NAD(P)-dependent dehydrogenase (short-subunit alcohol dehydrogenase family)
LAALARRAEKKGITVEEARAEREPEIPLRRFNEPADIAATVVFLASPAARNITGQSINVDGGITTS